MLADICSDSEMALWSALREGEESALARIYELHITGLLQYGFTLTPDKELVKDCVQELFINCWNQRERLGDARSVKFYLLISLKRLIIRQLRKVRTAGGLAHFHALHSEEFTQAHDEVIQDKERGASEKKILAREIEKLPRRQRGAIYLRFYEELSYDEISEIMNLNYQGVRNIIYKSVKALRKNMLNKWEHILFPILLLSHLLFT